jgi:hypothetical protein
MQMTFLNNVRKVGRLVLSRTSCLFELHWVQFNRNVNKKMGVWRRHIQSVPQDLSHRRTRLLSKTRKNVKMNTLLQLVRFQSQSYEFFN